MSVDIKTLAVELQSLGVRTTVPTGPGATRAGGAGPSDAGFLWVDGAPLTVPVHGDYVSRSPYELVLGTNGRAGTLFRDGTEVGRVTLHPRPKIYDLETADGVPYWKIGLMHLDSFASTVFQRCVYWGTDDQCHFLRDRHVAPVGSHHPGQDPGPAGRGRRRRGPVGRCEGRDAHHRIPEPGRSGRAVHGEVRGGDP